MTNDFIAAPALLALLALLSGSWEKLGCHGLPLEDEALNGQGEKKADR